MAKILICIEIGGPNQCRILIVFGPGGLKLSFESAPNPLLKHTISFPKEKRTLPGGDDCQAAALVVQISVGF